MLCGCAVPGCVGAFVVACVRALVDACFRIVPVVLVCVCVCFVFFSLLLLCLVSFQIFVLIETEYCESVARFLNAMCILFLCLFCACVWVGVGGWVRARASSLVLPPCFMT